MPFPVPDPTGGDPTGGLSPGLGGLSPGLGGLSPGLGGLSPGLGGTSPGLELGGTSELEGVSPSPEAAATDEGPALASVDASTMAAASDTEDVLTDMATGANELLSSAVPYAPSDPFSSAQAGWSLGAQIADNSALSAALTSFVGQVVDWYTGATPVDNNSNPFTGGQNVEPFSGASVSTGPLSDYVGPDVASTGAPAKGANGYADLWAEYQSGVQLEQSQLLAASRPLYPVYNSDQGGPGPSADAAARFLDVVEDSPPVETIPDVITITIVEQPSSVTWTDPVTIIGDPNYQSLVDNDQLMQAIQDAHQNDLLMQAIQNAVGQPSLADNALPADINEVPSETDSTPSLPSSISEDLSGTYLAPLLNPQAFQPAAASLGDSQQSVFSQVLSGTYSEFVLQQQLSNQGRLPGSFVSPTAPYDYLFNPNATSLAEAMLLGSHSPNAALGEAQGAELAASMTPVIGSISTWMNPRSGLFAKSMAMIGLLASVLPVASKLSSALGELGPELESLGPQIDEVIPSTEESFNPRLTARLAAWGKYSAGGGQLGMRDWVRSTQGAPWGTGYSSGYGRWFERAASATGDAASVVANNRSGRAFQQLVSDALEVPENFALMEGAPINIETRPDLLVDVALGEVKNYERSVLSYSSQIEAQMNAAISSGKTYVLITSPFTEATQQLIEAVRSINGIMVTFDPVTGAFTPWW